VITAIVRTDNPKLTVVGESVTNLGNYASGTSVVEVQGVDAPDQGGVPVGSKRRTFSVEKGFYGCKHFSMTNELQMKNGKAPIDWKLLTD
jgi:hypothetical protein